MLSDFRSRVCKQTFVANQHATQAVQKDHKRLEGFTGYDPQAALLLIMPDAFGQNAEVLAHAPRTGTDLAKHFGVALAACEVMAKIPRRHIAEGRSKDLVWKSATPVDD